MPRGGARVGSGRKPKARPMAGPALAVIEGGKVEAIGISRQPPADLVGDQRDFWQRYAGLAIEARTLTPQTEPTFRLLCEIDARRRKLLAQIEKEGETYIKAWVDASGQEHEELKKHPLSPEYRGLAQRAEALLARFSLAPFGKPTDAAPRRPAAKNLWGQVAGRG